MSISLTELLVLRNRPASEITDRYAERTRVRFDHDNGFPVLICTYMDADLAHTIAALGRSTIRLAPLVINNAPGQDEASLHARTMGARVLEEPIKGQMRAFQTGLQAFTRNRPGAPIMITDADCLPTKRWGETMLHRARLRHDIGGIASGGVVLEHGPSFATDTLRTAYAFGGDVGRRVFGHRSKVRGANIMMQFGSDTDIMSEVMDQPADVFPRDAVLRDNVQAAGGDVLSVLDPRSIVLTRGDRFNSVAALVDDLIHGETNRADRYREPT